MSTTDFFNRRERAKRLVQSIADRDAQKPEVIGIVGAWGSGKSTFLTFMREELEANSNYEKISTLGFNPWWFSSRTDLIQRFFTDVSFKFDDGLDKDKNAASKLKRFGAVLTAGAAFTELASYTVPVLKLMADVLKSGGNALNKAGEAAEQEAKSLDSIRKELIVVLEELRKPLWVFVDDIDRLQSEELLAMFVLLRSLGELPYIKFIVSVAPEGFNASLADTDLSTSYLDKILTESYYLPTVPPLYLLEFFKEQLTSRIPHLEPEQDSISRAFFGLQSLSLTPRKLERLANAVQHALSTNELFGEVAIHDLILIEALRLEAEPVYEAIRQNGELLIDSDVNRGKRAEQLLEEFKQTLPNDKIKLDSVMPVVVLLFPSLSEVVNWSRLMVGPHRIFEPEVFNTFFTSDPDAEGISQKRRRALWKELDKGKDDFWNQVKTLDNIETVMLALCDYVGTVHITRDGSSIETTQNRICTLLAVFGTWSRHSPLEKYVAWRVLASLFNSLERFPTNTQERFAKNLFDATSEAHYWVRLEVPFVLNKNLLLEGVPNLNVMVEEYQKETSEEARNALMKMLEEHTTENFTVQHLEISLPFWESDEIILDKVNSLPPGLKGYLADLALLLYKNSNSVAIYDLFGPVFKSDLFEIMIELASEETASNLQRDKVGVLGNTM